MEVFVPQPQRARGINAAIWLKINPRIPNTSFRIILNTYYGLGVTTGWPDFVVVVVAGLVDVVVAGLVDVVVDAGLVVVDVDVVVGFVVVVVVDVVVVVVVVVGHGS